MYGTYSCDIILNSVGQNNHFITQGNYKATCFDYRLVILWPILSVVSQDAMHTLGSNRVYIHGIHQIKSFVSKDVTCEFAVLLVRRKAPHSRSNIKVVMIVFLTLMDLCELSLYPGTLR